MSQRTIVEFNHDFGHEIWKRPDEFVSLLRQMINGGVNGNPDNSRGAALEDQLRSFGVTTSPTHHHSTKAEVVLATEHGREYWRQEF